MLQSLLTPPSVLMITGLPWDDAPKILKRRELLYLRRSQAPCSGRSRWYVCALAGALVLWTVSSRSKLQRCEVHRHGTSSISKGAGSMRARLRRTRRALAKILSRSASSLSFRAAHAPILPKSKRLRATGCVLAS